MCLFKSAFCQVSVTDVFYYTAPCGGEIEPVVYQTSATSYSVTYTPEEPGTIICHWFIINLKE